MPSWMIVNRNVVVKSCIWKQCESIAWVCWAHNHVWDNHFVIACHAPWDQLCCYLYPAVLPVSVIHKRKCIMHSTIRLLTFKHPVFCKDKRRGLIVECLFAKASIELELLKLRPLLREQQLICIKATYSKSERLGSYPKSGNLNKL